MIRPVKPTDATAIAEIYNHYIHTSISTFELAPIDAVEMEKRINAYSPKYPWLVYEENDKVLAYAYSSPWKARKAYKHTVESSVYLNHQAFGRGIGTTLYTQLMDELRAIDIHAVIGGISLPNPASIALHEKLGFEKIGQFTQVGRKFDQWIDVGYWELIMSEKSK